jgi:cell division inhibitor SepF
MSIWRRTMEYLGLGPDDAYDDYDGAPEPERAARPPRSRDLDQQQRDASRPPEYDTDSVRAVPARQTFPSREADYTGRRPLPTTDDSGVRPRPIGSPRPAGARGLAPVEPHTVRPRRFDAAQEVADKFKDGQPVIMNLEAADRDVSRRLIDFASGLCYALNGTMEKVATGVYLLKPPAPRHADNDFDS